MAAALALGACGKKGPPLAPLIPVPAGIDQISAARVGNDVYVTLTVPKANIDEYTPADVSRIEIFGYTGRTPPPRGRFVDLGTLVATVPVAPPPEPAPPPGEAPAKPKTPAVDAPRQGTQVTIVDTLTPEELVQGKEPVRDQGSGTRDQKLPVFPDPRSPIPDPRPAPPPPLRRFYTAFPFSARGRPGPPGANAELPIQPVPDAPASASVEYSPRGVTVTWEPSGGLIGYLFERPLPEEPLPPALDAALAEEEAIAPVSTVPEPAPSGPLMYNVYRTVSPDPFAPPTDAPAAAEWNSRPPAPLNPIPLPAFELVDALAFNEERCYTVRAVRVIGAETRVGEASPPACVTIVDTFAPAPPKGLATVASEGAINLIWEPNTEPDVRGYVVLRGEAPGDTLQPLTAAPIAEARYRDEAVTPGVRYVYAVMAIDNRFPVPNISDISEPTEETAR